MPEDYRIGIVPASDSGAYEMAMWTMLGARGFDILGWESFGKGWITDAVKQLKLDDIRVMEADYGELPDLGEPSILPVMSPLPGTAQPRACACPMAIGLPMTAKG